MPQAAPDNPFKAAFSSFSDRVFGPSAAPTESVTVSPETGAPTITAPPAVVPVTSVTPNPGVSPDALKTAVANAMTAGTGPTQPAPAPAVAPAPPAAPPTATQTEMTTAIAPKLDPVLKAKEQALFDKKLEHADAQLATEMEKNDAIKLANDDKRFKMATERARSDAEVAKIHTDTEAANQKYLASIDEFNTFRKKGAPDHSVGQSILHAIGQALGAFGQAYTGGPNTAAQIVAHKTDLMVRKWEKELEESKGAIDVAKNRVAFFDRQGMTAKERSAAARLTILDEAAEKVDEIAAGYSNPEMLNRAAALKDGIQLERQQYLNTQSLNEQNRQVRKTLTGPASTGMSVSDQVKLRGLEVEVPQGNGSIKKFMAKSETEAAKIRDAQKVVAGVNSDLLAMEALLGRGASWNPQTRQKINILNNQIRKKYIKLDELGVPTGKDLELSSVIGDPKAWTQTVGQTKDLIGSVRGDAATRLMQAYESQGFRE